MTRDGLRAVQRRALERALVDDTDARRYFALAGALDAARRSPVGEADGDPPGARDPPDSDAVGVDDALPAALVSLAVVPLLDADESSTATVTGPWTPGTETTRPAVRRGARLALRWFDVSVERVAARAGVPEVALRARSPDE
ncbi:hypothetical protein [Salinigranum sp. GCM10025319]|uniref:hypothetical protein n=1 Tax=Salinigranum sp. GCM10025319 TaxID=3252687 RepID=UPI00360D0AA0